MYYHGNVRLSPGTSKGDSVPGEKLFSVPPCIGWPAKNLDTKAERMSIGERFRLGLKGLICAVDK